MGEELPCRKKISYGHLPSLTPPMNQKMLAKEADAAELFHMLDASHEGHIQADEFLNGCLRLDGPAKAIDLAAFMEESRKAGTKHDFPCKQQ